MADCAWKIPGTDRHFSSSGRDPVFLSADHGTVRKHCFCIYLRGTAWFFSAGMYLPGCGTVLLVSYGKPDSCRSRNLRFSAGMLSDGWNSGFFPETAGASFFALVVIVLLIGLLIYHTTQNILLPLVIGVIGEGVLAVLYFVKQSMFEGIIQKILNLFNMSSHFSNFTNSILDLTGVVYYLSFIGIMLFLTVQSIQKNDVGIRRLFAMNINLKSKKPANMLRPKNKKLLKKGSYSLAFTVVILAIAVFLNLLIGELPSSATKIDVSENKLYSIGDETKNVASSLTEDVTLYLLAEDGSEDATLNELLTRYADLSSHIKYEKKDPVLNPSFASSYTDEDLASNSVIVVSDKRSKVIPYSDLYESSVNYQTYSMETTAFDGEGQVTSAIAYVTTEDLPILYTLTGHEENDLDSSMQSAIEKENIEVQELNLLTAGTVPGRRLLPDDQCSAERFLRR